MSRKRTRSEKIKARLRTLKEQGVEMTRAQLEKQKGMKSKYERRKKRAEREGRSISSIMRETEFTWTPDARLKWMESVALLPLTRDFRKAIAKTDRASRVMFSRIKGGYKDSNKDYKTDLGKELSRLPWAEAEWSKSSIAHPLLGEFEQKMSVKIGPRSFYRADAYRDIIMTWNDVSHVDLTDEIIRAFKSIGAAFPYVDRWEMSELGAVIKSMDRDKSAGYPWFAKKVEVISAMEREEFGLDTLDEKYKTVDIEKQITFSTNRHLTLLENESVITRVRKRLKLIASGSVPKVVNFQGLRTESAAFSDKSKEPYKQRLVWGVPYDQGLVEKLFCGKLQKEVLAGESEFASHYWGALEHHKNGGEKRVLELIDKAEEWDTDCISIDFSKFDQHITAPIMEQAIGVFKSHSSLTELEYEYLVYSLIHSELWTSWGVLERHNGVPSGSFFTNLVDSTINAAFNEAVGLRFNCEVDYVVNGDDCCMVLSKNIPTSEIVKVGVMFGMEMNEGKQWRKRDAFSFDQEVFARELNGSTPMLHRVLNSMMRHDQRKDTLSGINEVSAFYSQLRRLQHHPFKEVFLTWILENTWEEVEMNRFNPANYTEVDLPGVERYNAEPVEKEVHAVSEYKHDWFWDLVSYA